MSKFRILKILRWSYTVPILCYILFLIMTLMVTVPLKPTVSGKPEASFFNLPKLEDSFQVRIKNSNFNMDKGSAPKLDERGDYLVNVRHGENDQIKILTQVFKQADKDNNNKLDSKELSHWIRSKIVEHISQAVGNNYDLFVKIDCDPKNGVVTWREYHSYFLKKRGFGVRYVNSHDERRHKGLKRSIKEQIMKDKAMWSEAAKTKPDALTVDEFLAFTHPESSVSNQLALVDELFDKFDRDGDEILTENEFAVLHTEGIGDETLVVHQEEEQRRLEFRTTIDLNGDGGADRRELLRYVAPQSPRHAEHEAEALLSLADTDHDNALTLDEILARPDLFIKSKMVDTARSFHDEF